MLIGSIRAARTRSGCRAVVAFRQLPPLILQVSERLVAQLFGFCVVIFVQGYLGGEQPDRVIGPVTGTVRPSSFALYPLSIRALPSA